MSLVTFLLQMDFSIDNTSLRPTILCCLRLVVHMKSDNFDIYHTIHATPSIGH
jgi:hypothetical protein